MKKRTLLSWSSGKDSAWALHILRQDPEVELVGLFTTINQAFDRVAMHGVRAELLRAQAEAAGLPLDIIALPWPCDHADYARLMADYVGDCKTRGISHMAFGDLYLDSVRAYREENLAGSGIAPLFPLWGQSTRELPHTMLAAGLKARITCLDGRKLPAALAGSRYDAQLLAALPADCDPCAENGEFHTFAWDGPMFRHPVAHRVGDTVERDGYLFTDLLPAC
ncbi:adenine nucleotide alpha hydrolase [uncultured Aquitalea sp.]|uniref:adenine nucleotide alpha hydrolase n=1 Tax=uncultured Aquitalea sp. TaxID=540272 RepID=UPI0025DD19AC|nr:adenine nucleotide alpha hydrolase [uncultured Aquitalea sp.]